MIDEASAKLHAHRQNINRYRGLLQTNLTILERDFIERRIAEEETKVTALTGTFPSTATFSDMPISTRV
jgi:hypothetical protein